MDHGIIGEDAYMANLPPYPDSDGDTGPGADHGSTTGTPRWVKVFGIIAIFLILMIGIILVTGLGSHGPGRHSPSGNSGSHTPPIEHRP